MKSFCKNCNLYLDLSKKNLCAFCNPLDESKAKPLKKFSKYIVRQLPQYKEWRKTILLRDSFCVLCGSKANQVDHIVPLAEILKKY